MSSSKKKEETVLWWCTYCTVVVNRVDHGNPEKFMECPTCRCGRTFKKVK